ncbi:hypothetical protein [Mesorhizobium sp. M0767]|uniref:hypothetical protein n=1 Tax=unclassified Mesorhizobium TaxID=325217 RepID=UPI00333517A4
MAGTAMPNTKLLLLQDYKPGRGITPDYQELREQLVSLPGFDNVELTPTGRSGVFATVPARNELDRERLKALVNEKVQGWRVIEEQSYDLPNAV